MAYALYSRSTLTKIAAFILLTISSIGALLSYLTGEAAEELAENIPGISENAIGAHEESAYTSLLLLILLGISALVGLFFSIKKSSQIKKISIFTLIVAIICFFQISRTGFLGGQIRHHELIQNNADLQNTDFDED